MSEPTYEDILTYQGAYDYNMFGVSYFDMTPEQCGEYVQAKKHAQRERLACDMAKQIREHGIYLDK